MISLGSQDRKVWRSSGGPKDDSFIVDDQPAGNLKTRHDQPDLKRSDKDSFQGTIRRCQKCVDPQGSFTNE